MVIKIGGTMGIFEDPISKKRKPFDQWNDENWDDEDGDSEIADTELWDDDTNTGYNEEDY